MRKGARRADWTVADERFLWENAGKVPRRELCRRLKRSGEAVDQKAKRMGLSLRCYVPKCRPCPKCGKPRSQFGRDGTCRVCGVKALIRRADEDTSRAMAMLPPEHLATYQATEVLLQSTPLPKPKAPSYEGLTAYQEAKARDEHARALEEWEFGTLNRRLKAKRRRVERMRKKIENQ